MISFEEEGNDTAKESKAVELEMQVKKIRNENSVLLQEAVEPHYIRYIVAKD